MDEGVAGDHRAKARLEGTATVIIVLEAADVAAYNIYQLYNPYRLVIDCAKQLRRAPAPGFRQRDVAVQQIGAPNLAPET